MNQLCIDVSKTGGILQPNGAFTTPEQKYTVSLFDDSHAYEIGIDRLPKFPHNSEQFARALFLIACASSEEIDLANDSMDRVWRYSR